MGSMLRVNVLTLLLFLAGWSFELFLTRVFFIFVDLLTWLALVGDTCK